MRQITSLDENRPPITVEFTAAEFEAVAHLFYVRAKNTYEQPITKAILEIARKNNLNIQHDRLGVVAGR